MKLLFIAQAKLSKELGGPKVLLEIAEAVIKMGHEVDVVGPEEVYAYLKNNSLPTSKEFAYNINIYLNIVAKKYDAIDVDANHLYKFSYKGDRNMLIVARSVLFIPHLTYIKLPQNFSLLQKIKSKIKSLFHPSIPTLSKRFYASCSNADLINVSNHKDVEQLLSVGYNKNKIVDIPYALTLRKRQRLLDVSTSNKSKSNVVFLGTFDYRKGCLDIPKIFTAIKQVIPEATLTLLGVKGLFQTKEEIYSFFPDELRSSVNIILSFKEHELPELLKEFKIAIFPSYLEGFGFSVIESMSAGIPVIAYDAPGPASILAEKYLVKAGDWEGMAKKAVYYLTDNSERTKAAQDMILGSQKYDWDVIARETIDAYDVHLHHLRSQLTAK